jgi:hypothetical protein
MKKVVLIFLLIMTKTYGQVADTLSVETDTIVSKKVTSSWYARSMFVSLLSANTSQTDETIKTRFSQNIEFGKSFGMVDLGISIGYAASIDSIPNNHTDLKTVQSQYILGKLSMDACQYGIFSNEITIGGGYMFNKTTPIMLEISSTIFAQIGENWGLGVVYGNYNFTGDKNDLNKTFTGLFLRYGLIRDDGGILLSRTRVVRGKRPNRSRTHHNNN